MPLGIEPPNAPNFTDERLIANIEGHVEKLSPERLRAALDALLTYKDGRLRKVLTVYVSFAASKKAFSNVTHPTSGVPYTEPVGQVAFQYASLQARELLSFTLDGPISNEHLRKLVVALEVLYANDRVITGVQGPGVFLEKWLASVNYTSWTWCSFDRYTGADHMKMTPWFDLANRFELCEFLSPPPGRVLAELLRKSFVFPVESPEIPAVSTIDPPVQPPESIDVPLPMVTPAAGTIGPVSILDDDDEEIERPAGIYPREPDKAHRMRLRKTLVAMRHLRIVNPNVEQLRGYNAEHRESLLNVLGTGASEALAAWAQSQSRELPSLEEAEVWGAKVHELCGGISSHGAAMRSVMLLLTRVVVECSNDNAEVYTNKRAADPLRVRFMSGVCSKVENQIVPGEKVEPQKIFSHHSDLQTIQEAVELGCDFAATIPSVEKAL